MFTKITLIIALRYFIIAGIAFIIYYWYKKKDWLYKKIQPKFPKQKDYLREIAYSLITIVIFSSVSYSILGTSLKQYTFFYSAISDYGWWWFAAAFIIMLFVHDAYFYFAHRAMHHKFFFKYVHLIHHKSTNPSPWAAFAFHPLEAIVEVGIVVIFLFIMPITKYHLVFFFLFMMVYNVYGHLGWELYPKNFATSKFGKWINTSVNHNQHHQYFKGNYGLYFLWWDRWLGTLREDYDKQFEEVALRSNKLNQTA